MALAIGCATANLGCKSGTPESATWLPAPVADAQSYAVRKADASTQTTDPSAPQVLQVNGAVASQPNHAGVVPASADPQAAGYAVAPASHLSLAQPYQVQEPETVTPPDPAETLPDIDGQQSRTNQQPAERADAGRMGSDQENATEPLGLEDVAASVRNTYPKIREAVARQAEANGQILSAWGSFDTNLRGDSINQPLGFYENYRQSIGVKQPLWNGGDIGAGYRIGDGSFEPWYGERETDEGGEFRVGLDLPVLQNRAIDKRRAALRAAELRRGQTDPELFLEILMAQGDAAVAYWTWVAAGINVKIQENLLKLASDRVEQFEKQIAEEDIPRFRKLDNDRLIAVREIKLIEAQQKLAQSAVKLSLYLRNANGVPILPPPDALPADFPVVPDQPVDEAVLINAAIQARPETRILQFDAATLRVELAQATNELLPELNVMMDTFQNVGEPASSKGDKSPTKVQAGFYGEVPLQRRMARGKIDSLNAKLRQVEAKLQLATDRIATDVQQILVARDAALRQIEQAEINLELARETLRIGAIGLREGEFTLPILNIYEQALADAEAAMLIAKAEYFIADSILRVAIGLELDVDSPVIPPAAVAP